MEVEKTASRGRPRGFCCEKALEAAMRVFWQHGYEGASLDELTKAMGINRPSLYAAFGNKEALFRKVMDKYGAGPGAHACAALHEPTARGVVEKMWRGTAELLGNPNHPRGCLGTHGVLACGTEAEPVRQEMVARREAGVVALKERFERAIAEGDLPDGSDAGALARYVATVAQGMSVQAASGASGEELMKVAEIALKSWPG